jgi:5,10-methylene-tetrahydrofolate dehydrogenase/methenyl tetrahydrofolate cyclohydrolase
MSNIISGKQIASDITDKIKNRIDVLKLQHATTPSLSVILVGTKIQSETYVRLKKRECDKVGIKFVLHRFDDDVNQEKIITKVRSLNIDTTVNGILVQLPLPSHIDSIIVIDAIDPEKDVDGLTSINLGKLVSRRNPCHIPCTPKGIIRLFDTIGINLEKKNVVILGRSNIVGMPLFHLVSNRNATVTLCHSATDNLIDKIKIADIVISAIGFANYIQGSWLKIGAIVIDIGINLDMHGKLVGDVHFDSCSRIASYITPVPGGVGPMTIAMVLENTLDAYIRSVS